MRLISSSPNVSFVDAEMQVVSCVVRLLSYVLSLYEEGISQTGGQGTRHFGAGLGGVLKSAELIGESVDALSFAVIQWRTRTLKRTRVQA